jgi:calcineurin-like phosphoesterase family protein
MLDGKDWMTREAALASTGVNERTLRKWVERGILERFITPGGRGANKAYYRYVEEPEEPVSVASPNTFPVERNVKKYYEENLENWLHAFTKVRSKRSDLNIVFAGADNNTEGNALCLLLSDTHVGKVTKEYDVSIAKERIASIADKVTEIILSDTDQVVLLLAGDMVDGEDVYPHQAHTLELPVVKQAQVVAASIWELINSIRGLGVSVRVETCPGNHGRTSKTADTKTNWDNVSYMLLEAIAQTYNDPYINVRASFEDFNPIDVLDKRILMHHYGTKHAGTGATQVRMAGWQQIFDWDFMVSGHYHRWSVESVLGRLMMKNGSLGGNDDLTIKLGYTEPPRQGWFVVEKDVPITIMGCMEWD